MAKPRKKRSKNKRPAPQDKLKVPRSMVFSRLKIGSSLRALEHDLRKVMLPFTALRLKESPRNKIKDFLHIAGPLGVTHFLILSSSKISPYLRIARTPRGPTLTFKILSYALSADVINAQTRPRVPGYIFEQPPLVVMNGLGGNEEHMKLITVMFQNMFPAININTVNLSNCQRVLLLDYDKEKETIEFRHYAIGAQPVGVSRNIRKLVQRRVLPDLSSLNDVSEFVMRSGYGSESEMEDESTRVQLPQKFGRGNEAKRQSAVKLSEVGPRLTLQLVKVHAGLSSGVVMYHRYVEKTKEEVEELGRKIVAKDELKKKRKAEQEANVLKKKKNIRKKMNKNDNSVNDSGQDSESQGTKEKRGMDDEEIEEDDDVWYRKEVGEDPNEGYYNSNDDSKKKSRVKKGRK